MNPVNWAGSVFEILPPHAFRRNNFDFFSVRNQAGPSHFEVDATHLYTWVES